MTTPVCMRPMRLHWDAEDTRGNFGEYGASIPVDRQFDFRDADFSRVRKHRLSSVHATYDDARLHAPDAPALGR
ncbi:hypothetical protein CTI14_64335 [Methylobacterium radiotolerans]|nr:hypothetical protein CTI14_64335 [Methylobacterium radiotolerans]